MAIKDWKKTLFGWKKEREGLLRDKSVEISYLKNNFTSYKGKIIKSPIYAITTFDEKANTKLFKTKQQALKFAREYMRKH